MIRAALFDYGGVLTRGGRSGFVTQTIATLYDVDPTQVHMQQEHAALRRGRGSIDDLFARLNRQYGKHVTKEMFAAQLTPGVPEVYILARRMRAQGIRTAIFSNIFAINAEVLRQRGAYDGFDPVILSFEEGYAKPDPEFYEIAVQRVRANPPEILLIDDQEKCLGPARRLGMKVVLATSPEQIIADVTALIKVENGIDL